jgi:hypothetical protein
MRPDHLWNGEVIVKCSSARIRHSVMASLPIDYRLLANGAALL